MATSVLMVDDHAAFRHSVRTLLAFDLAPDILRGVRRGTILFAIDQQLLQELTNGGIR